MQQISLVHKVNRDMIMLASHHVVSEFNRYWERGELEAAMNLVADLCVLTVHVSEDLVEHAGQWVGADQIRQALAVARRTYDYTVYRPVILGSDGNTVRVRVEFMGTHRQSGEQMSMTFRQVFVTRNGQITRCDEYHDRSKLEAYMKLIQTYSGQTGTGS